MSGAVPAGSTAGSTAGPTAGPTVTVRWTVAVDAGSRDLAAAEHLAAGVVAALAPVLRVGAGDVVVSTHVVGAPTRHVALVATGTGAAAPVAAVVDRVAAAAPDGFVLVRAGDDEATAGSSTYAAEAVTALQEHLTRRAGRLVHYPGQDAVQRRVAVGEITDVSCIDRIDVVGGLGGAPEQVADLTGFARPTWRDGVCTLLLQPGHDVLIAFEVRDQIACCSAH